MIKNIDDENVDIEMPKVEVIKNITDENFDAEVLDSEAPVLVYFAATWCQPCVAQKPIVETFASECLDVKVVKVDVAAAPKATKENGVRSVPTLMLFKNGKEMAIKPGLTRIEDIRSMVKN